MWLWFTGATARCIRDEPEPSSASASTPARTRKWLAQWSSISPSASRSGLNGPQQRSADQGALRVVLVGDRGSGQVCDEAAEHRKVEVRQVVLVGLLEGEAVRHRGDEPDAALDQAGELADHLLDGGKMLEPLEADDQVDLGRLERTEVVERVGGDEADVLRPRVSLGGVDGRDVAVHADDRGRPLGQQLRAVAGAAAEVEHATTGGGRRGEAVAVAMLGGDQRVGADRVEAQPFLNTHAVSLSRSRASISPRRRASWRRPTSRSIEEGRMR